MTSQLRTLQACAYPRAKITIHYNPEGHLSAHYIGIDQCYTYPMKWRHSYNIQEYIDTIKMFLKERVHTSKPVWAKPGTTLICPKSYIGDVLLPDVEIRKPLDGNICIQRIDHYTMCQVPTHTVATLTPGKYHLPPYLICKECEFVVKQKFLELVRVLHYYRKHHYV